MSYPDPKEEAHLVLGGHWSRRRITAARPSPAHTVFSLEGWRCREELSSQVLITPYRL